MCLVDRLFVRRFRATVAQTQRSFGVHASNITATDRVATFCIGARGVATDQNLHKTRSENDFERARYNVNVEIGLHGRRR